MFAPAENDTAPVSARFRQSTSSLWLSCGQMSDRRRNGAHKPSSFPGQSLADSDAKGYTRFGRGPLRAIHPEARGWLFAAGELAMTARDLALWDISLMQGKLLKHDLMDEMIKPPLLN
jgi:hypothetical protein